MKLTKPANVTAVFHCLSAPEIRLRSMEQDPKIVH